MIRYYIYLRSNIWVIWYFCSRRGLHLVSDLEGTALVYCVRVRTHVCSSQIQWCFAELHHQSRVNFSLDFHALYFLDYTWLDQGLMRCLRNAYLVIFPSSHTLYNWDSYPSIHRACNLRRMSILPHFSILTHFVKRPIMYLNLIYNILPISKIP